MRSTLLQVLLAAAVCVTALGATEGKPNFSGEWQMDAGRSDFGRFPMPTVMTRVIVDKAPDLDVETTQRGANGERSAHVHYRSDGGSTTNRLSSGVGTSHAFWDGNTLVIRTNINVREDVEVVMEDRWELSGDGKTLTTTSHIETNGGANDLKLVCTRVK